MSKHEFFSSNLGQRLFSGASEASPYPNSVRKSFEGLSILVSLLTVKWIDEKSVSKRLTKTLQSEEFLMKICWNFARKKPPCWNVSTLPRRFTCPVTIRSGPGTFFPRSMGSHFMSCWNVGTTCFLEPWKESPWV